MAKPVKPSMGCGYLVTLLLAGVGLFVLGAAVRTYGDYEEKVNPRIIVLAALGVLFLGGAVAYLRYAKKVVAEAEATGRLAEANPGKPWLLKKEWQGETAPPPEPGARLLDAYTVPTVENTDLRAAGIERGVGGWRFGSTHLGGTKIVMTMIAVGALAGCIALRQVHWVPFVVVGMFALVISLVALDLWFDGFELRVIGEEVLVRKSRPWGAKEWRVPRSDVADVRAEKSMSSGNRQYHLLALVGSAGADPRPPHPAETFAARKLRYQLKRAGKELGVSEPEKMGGRGRELLEKMATTPRFEIIFAKHVPGGAVLEVVKAGVLADSRKL